MEMIVIKLTRVMENDTVIDTQGSNTVQINTNEIKRAFSEGDGVRLFYTDSDSIYLDNDSLLAANIVDSSGNTLSYDTVNAIIASSSGTSLSGTDQDDLLKNCQCAYWFCQ